MRQSIFVRRLVSAFRHFVSRQLRRLNNLYRETGWLTLSNRRLYHKLILMYKIKNSMVPNYLITLFPRTVDNPVNYNLRNTYDFNNYHCRTSTFGISFVPSSIDAWNNLPLYLRNSPSISCFKYYLKIDN